MATIHTETPNLRDDTMPIYRGSRIRSFRCPAELDKKIEEFTERTGTDPTGLIRAALEEYLDKYMPDKRAKKKEPIGSIGLHARRKPEPYRRHGILPHTTADVKENTAMTTTQRHFGKTDVNLVQSGRYAALSNGAKATLYVITTIASFRSGQFFHSASKIASLAGISQRTAQRALAELLDSDVISVVRYRPGETTLYRYNFAAGQPQPTTPMSQVTQNDLPNLRHPCHTTYDTHVVGPTTPMSWVYKKHPPQTRANQQSTASPISLTRTTEQEVFKETTTAAQRVPDSLIARMRSQHGNDVVSKVLLVMSLYNGEVKNAAGYFRTWCQKAATNEWDPESDTKLIAFRKKQAREEAQKKQQEEWDAQQKELKRQEQERQELANFFDTLSDDEKDEVLRQAQENAAALPGIGPDMLGFEMCVLEEEYKILRQRRST